MKAMLLAAGLATRMGELVKDRPKCLLEVAGKPLIEYHLEALAKAGVKEVIINTAFWATLTQASLGDGRKYGLRIDYSVETHPLETGGGIYQALPLLGDHPFMVINTDVWTDYPFVQLLRQPNKLAHLVFVDNPGYSTRGDFYLQDGIVNETIGAWLTYSGIGVYRPEFFANCRPTVFPLKQPMLEAIAQQALTGEHYQGQWVDVGTPERWCELNQQLRKGRCHHD